MSSGRSGDAEGPGPSLRAVMVGDLRVTLAPVADLQAEATRLSAEAAALNGSAGKLGDDAVARLVEAGMILVAREKEWAPSNPAAAFQLGRAREAIASIDAAGGMPEDAEDKPKFALFGRRKETESPEARAERERLAADLRAVLSELGRSFGAALAAVSSAQEKAIDMEARAEADRQAARVLQEQADTLSAEAAARERAVLDLGFDAPLAAANLQESGAPPLKVPLQLRPGEIAYVAEQAELAREKGYAINASGPSAPPPPVEVTGIPFAVGNHRGKALARDSLSMLGPGVFVVTNQRLGFVGKLKSFSFAIADLLSVEQYRDGLSLLREGRDNADVVICAGASRVLFYTNWALLHAPQETDQAPSPAG